MSDTHDGVCSSKVHPVSQGEVEQLARTGHRLTTRHIDLQLLEAKLGPVLSAAPHKRFEGRPLHTLEDVNLVLL